MKTAALAANAETGTISEISVASATSITVTGDPAALDSDFATNFHLYYPNGTVSSGTITLTEALPNYATSSYSKGATWTPADGWVAAD